MRDPSFILATEAERHTEVDQLREELEVWQNNALLMRESIAELELALEDEGWRRIGLEGEREFSRTGLDKIISMARIMYLKNPLIQRGVEIRAFYVWGQGVEIQSDNEDINAVVQSFLDDRFNRKEFTGHAARVLKEKKLQSEGNLFFVLATNRLSGRVALRSLPTQEIRDVIKNPDDKNDIWFYRREWIEERFNMADGSYTTKTRVTYYPDVNHRPPKQPKTIGGNEVKWDQPVYHVKVGGFDDMRFGVPETYAALDWAFAYKSFLEDWATLVKAISRFAWKVSKKNKSQIATAKARLATTRTTSTEEDNPPPTAGAYWIEDQDTQLTPINKSGATTSAGDGKMLRLMVASALHLPDTILSNDPQQGALATAKTLDRPTELAMKDRQSMWEDVLRDILMYVVTEYVRANPSGIGNIVTDELGDHLELNGDQTWDLQITFPPIIEMDLKDRIDALVSAMTLDGKTDAGIAPKDLFRRMLLSAIGVRDIDKVLEDMGELDEQEPQQEEESFIPAEDLKAFVEELKQLRETLVAA